jgi:hypothetical protein
MAEVRPGRKAPNSQAAYTWDRQYATVALDAYPFHQRFVRIADSPETAQAAGVIVGGRTALVLPRGISCQLDR